MRATYFYLSKKVDGHLSTAQPGETQVGLYAVFHSAKVRPISDFFQIGIFQNCFFNKSLICVET